MDEREQHDAERDQTAAQTETDEARSHPAHAPQGAVDEGKRDEALKGIGLQEHERQHEDGEEPEQDRRGKQAGVGDHEQDEERRLAE